MFTSDVFCGSYCRTVRCRSVSTVSLHWCLGKKYFCLVLDALDFCAACSWTIYSWDLKLKLLLWKNISILKHLPITLTNNFCNNPFKMFGFILRYLALRLSCEKFYLFIYWIFLIIYLFSGSFWKGSCA